jgi:hypothetical protein
MTSIPTDLTLLADEALEAFWSTLAHHFPDATAGDLSPERTIGLQMAAEEAIKEWIESNAQVDSALRP